MQRNIRAGKIIVKIWCTLRESEYCGWGNENIKQNISIEVDNKLIGAASL